MLVTKQVPSLNDFVQRIIFFWNIGIWKRAVSYLPFMQINASKDGNNRN
jgi:hypothetical protein